MPAEIFRHYPSLTIGDNMSIRLGFKKKYKHSGCRHPAKKKKEKKKERRMDGDGEGKGAALVIFHHNPVTVE